MCLDWLKATFLFFSHNVVNFMEGCFLLALVMVTLKLCGETGWAAPLCGFPKEGALDSLKSLRGICPRAGCCQVERCRSLIWGFHRPRGRQLGPDKSPDTNYLCCRWVRTALFQKVEALCLQEAPARVLLTQQLEPRPSLWTGCFPNCWPWELGVGSCMPFRA